MPGATSDDELHGPSTAGDDESGAVRHAVSLFLLVIVLLSAGAYVAGTREARQRTATKNAGRAKSELAQQIQLIPSATTVPQNDAGLRPGAKEISEQLPPGHNDQGYKQQHGKDIKKNPKASDNCAVCHTPASCTKCHEGLEMPHPKFFKQAHGKIALAQPNGCTSECHKNQQKDCGNCHKLSMPHPAGYAKGTGHKADVKTFGTALCADCHKQAECEKCHQPADIATCTKCHQTQVQLVSKPNNGHATKCLDCHEYNLKVLGPDKLHRNTTTCDDCHDPAEFMQAVVVQSGREWMRAAGKGVGKWVARGSHEGLEPDSCKDCHDPHDVSVKGAFPSDVTDIKMKNCAEGCHGWMQNEIVSKGFTNILGDPAASTYSGTMSPEQLLASGTTKHTTEVYDKNGCAGKCHKGPHGAITTCVECHDFKLKDPANLHLTHIPMITAEQAVTDPGDVGQLACAYCHTGGDGEGGLPVGSTMGNASCWNCHLSGHDPSVKYWKLPIPN